MIKEQGDYVLALLTCLDHENTLAKGEEDDGNVNILPERTDLYFQIAIV